MLLGSALCCYGGMCVVKQCSMLLWWTVCCWAVQYVFTVDCILLGSAICCYGGLCVEQRSMLLRRVVLLISAVCCYGGLCC